MVGRTGRRQILRDDLRRIVGTRKWGIVGDSTNRAAEGGLPSLTLPRERGGN